MCGVTNDARCTLPWLLKLSPGRFIWRTTWMAIPATTIAATPAPMAMFCRFAFSRLLSRGRVPAPGAAARAAAVGTAATPADKFAAAASAAGLPATGLLEPPWFFLGFFAMRRNVPVIQAGECVLYPAPASDSCPWSQAVRFQIGEQTQC